MKGWDIDRAERSASPVEAQQFRRKWQVPIHRLEVGGRARPEPCIDVGTMQRLGQHGNRRPDRLFMVRHAVEHMTLVSPAGRHIVMARPGSSTGLRPRSGGRRGSDGQRVACRVVE